VFRRRKGGQPDESQVDELDVEATDEVEDDDAPAPPVDRSNGPWDESEVPDDGLTRLDVGGLRVPGADGMELRLDVDEATQAVMAVTAVLGDSALQMTVFAAPRTDGIWDDVRGEIRKSLAAQGTVNEVESDFGHELHAALPAQGPDGKQVVQPVRFVGIDGPRWFLRGLFSGRAARDRDAAAPLEAVLRATVVVRGTDPMAPGDAIPLRVPTEVPQGMSRSGEGEGEGGRAPLPPPERGPEITEIR
jgi:Protein of unknown function (DUF3710)